MTETITIPIGRLRRPDPQATIERIEAVLSAAPEGADVTVSRADLEALVQVTRDAHREAQAVWRCAVSDFVGCLDMLRDRWKASRRRNDREAGARLATVLDAVYAGRSPAPHDHASATRAGKDLIERVRAAMMEEALAAAMKPLVDGVDEAKPR